MKLRVLAAACAVALSLSLGGCALFGVDPDEAESARQSAEVAVATAELGVGFAKVLFAGYAALPVCGGEDAICHNPQIAQAGTIALAALSDRLADLRGALAADLDDSERLAQFVSALVAAVGDVNSVVSAIQASPAGVQMGYIPIIIEGYGG